MNNFVHIASRGLPSEINDDLEVQLICLAQACQRACHILPLIQASRDWLVQGADCSHGTIYDHCAVTGQIPTYVGAVRASRSTIRSTACVQASGVHTHLWGVASPVPAQALRLADRDQRLPDAAARRGSTYALTFQTALHLCTRYAPAVGRVDLGQGYAAMGAKVQPSLQPCADMAILTSFIVGSASCSARSCTAEKIRPNNIQLAGDEHGYKIKVKAKDFT